jgi:hypothetical protein
MKISNQTFIVYNEINQMIPLCTFSIKFFIKSNFEFVNLITKPNYNIIRDHIKQAVSTVVNSILLVAFNIKR